MTDALRADWQLIDSVRDRAYDIFVFAEKSGSTILSACSNQRGQSHPATGFGSNKWPQTCAPWVHRLRGPCGAGQRGSNAERGRPMVKPNRKTRDSRLSKIQQRWMHRQRISHG